MIRNKNKQNEIIEFIPYGFKTTCIAYAFLLNTFKYCDKNKKYASEYSVWTDLICNIDFKNLTERECNIIDYFFRHEVLESTNKDIAQIYDDFFTY